MMNPVTGREAKWSRMNFVLAGEEKNILVVGGGPSGMKLASVAARRGHQVTLVEQRDELGGHLNLLGELPQQAGWAVAADDLVRAVQTAGVDVKVGTRVDADFVRDFGADKVYVATGARYDDRGVSVWSPHLDEVPGIFSPTVLGVDEAARRALDEGGKALGDHVVIVDESGSYLPLGLAEILASEGTKVQVITPQLFVGSDVLRHLELPWVMPRLKEVGVQFHAQRRLDAVNGKTVMTADLWSNEEHAIENVSTLVLSVYRRSNTDLYDQLKDLGDVVEKVGDSLAPRKMAALTYEAELIGRSI